jgi:hypothetical protein
MDEEVGLVAHNSFIHGFVELGIFGGPIFLGMFTCGLLGLYRLGSLKPDEADREMVRARPYLMAIVAGYAVCLLTLTRNYVVPTYMIIGLAGAYFAIIRSRSSRLLPVFDGRFVVNVYLIGISFLIVANAFTRLLVRHD